MNILEVIEEKIGGKWVGVIFHNNIPEKARRLCEAIGRSYKNKIILTRESVDCPRAYRSLGWLRNNNDSMVHKLAEKMDTSHNIAQKLITRTPYIRQEITAVSVGDYHNPDIVVSYTTPNVAMNLVRLWQKISGTNLTLDVSTIMAAWGNIVVKAYLTGQICMSFGCPDSRECGCIEANKLIIGIPINLIENLL